MRGKRTILAAAVTSAVLAWPVTAAANGGAYVDLDRTHYRPGSQGVATTYVSVPERKESLFDLGPFYLFALPEGRFLQEGRPIPEGAVRIGTFTVEEEGKEYELAARFTVPQVAGGFYSLSVCNDPCTVSGFRESLTGTISIVATEREAQLLVDNNRLWNRVYRARHEARQIARDLEQVELQLQAQQDFAASERAELSTEIERLEAQLAAARRRAADAARPAFDPWVVGAIVALTLVAAALMFRRRRLTLKPIEPAPLAPQAGNGKAAGELVGLAGSEKR